MSGRDADQGGSERAGIRRVPVPHPSRHARAGSAGQGKEGRLRESVGSAGAVLPGVVR